MFELRALGAADLRTSDGLEVSPVVAQPKRLALLIYLASRAGATSRDELLSRFWPERDNQHARQSLNQALTFLRRALGTESIVSRGEDAVAVILTGLSFDARSFEDACARGDYDEAVALYRGDFLDGFFVSDASAELDEWIARERARLRQAANAAYWRIAERALAAHDADRARAFAQFAIALAPDDERGVRRLVDLLESIGDRGGAMRVYEQFASRLQREFGVVPSGELQDAVASIKAKLRPDGKSEAARSAIPASPATRTHTRRLAPIFAVIAAAIAIVAVAAAIAPGYVDSSDPGARRVAVAPFRNATGDTALDLISAMAADWMTEELQRAGLVGVVPMETVLQSNVDSLPSAVRASARELRRLTGADLAIIGSYLLVNDSLLYDVKIVDATDGSLRGAPVLVRAPRADVMGGLDVVRERVAGSLATLLDPQSQSSVSITSAPPRLPAFQEYIRGMDAFYRRGVPRDALVHFARARAEDSTYVAPLLASATIYFAMGSGSRAQADSVVHIVASKRNWLSEFERLQLDRWEALLREDLQSSYVASAKIADLAPRSHFVEMHVMDASSTLHLREAVAALEQLDPSWPWVRDWQGYWASLAYAYHDLGDYDRQLAAARRARAIRPDYLRFLWLEVQALIGSDRLDEVRTRLDECTTLPFGFDDRRRDSWTPGDVMRNAALELRAHGHAAFAHEVLERGHRWFAAHPGPAASNPAQAQYNRLQRIVELERWREAAVIADSLIRGDSSNVEAHVYRGRAAAAMGDSMRARAEMAFLSHPDKRGVISARLYGSAKIAAQLGDRGTALDLLEAAFAHGQRHTFWDHLESSFEPLRRDTRYLALMTPSHRGRP